MKKLIYGIFIGISYLIPGLCSASLAITLGLYEDLIEVFSSFYKPKIIKKYLLFIVGMIVGIIIAFIFFVGLYNKIPFVFTAIFIGFIIGSIKNNNKIVIKTNKDFILLFIILIIMFVLNIVGNNRLFNLYIFDNSSEYISLFLVSILASIALILPGISGSMILFMFGKYDKILESVKGIIISITKFQTLRNGDIAVIMVFLVGIIGGIIVFSKIIDKISKTNKELFEVITYSFLLGSLLILVYNLLFSINSFTVLTVSSLVIIIGYLIYKMIFNKLK